MTASTDFGIDELLPDYSPAATDYAALPSYSCKSHISETSLDFDTCRLCSNTEGRHTYESPAMFLDLGTRVWGIETPAFGNEGIVKGSLRLKDNTCPMSIVSVSLVISAFVAGERSRKLWSQKKLVRDLSVDPLKKHEAIPFSVPIPATITVGNQTIFSPPSLKIGLGESKAEISYYLIVALNKKKGLFRSGTSIRVPILYLPKTRPQIPPLKCYPCLDLDGVDIRFKEGMHNVLLSPKSSGYAPASQLQVFYSRPDVDAFASGSIIPITLTLANVPHKKSREYVHKFASSIAVLLDKRTHIASPVHHTGTAIFDTRLSQVIEFSILHVSGGVWQLRGTVETGTDGRESSWHIPGMVTVQYLISIKTTPQSDCSLFEFPALSYKEQVKLTTDPWGSCRYELNSTSGVPVPAMGLTKAQSCTHCRKLDGLESSDTSTEAHSGNQKIH